MVDSVLVVECDEQAISYMEIKSKTISTLISSSIEDVKLSFHHLMIQICIILSSQLKLDRDCRLSKSKFDQAGQTTIFA